jgi:hypothetical protein
LAEKEYPFLLGKAKDGDGDDIGTLFTLTHRPRSLVVGRAGDHEP